MSDDALVPCKDRKDAPKTATCTTTAISVTLSLWSGNSGESRIQLKVLLVSVVFIINRAAKGNRPCSSLSLFVLWKLLVYKDALQGHI